ncbi:MAG: hypothetical protein J5994_10720 [Ruminococcus sp.]|nr:hypothetical protein [Ruminococcus sp.]
MKKDNKKEKISLKKKINGWLTDPNLTIVCVAMLIFSIFLIWVYRYTEIYSYNIYSSIMIGSAIALFPKIPYEIRNAIYKECLQIFIYLIISLFAISYYLTVIQTKISFIILDIPALMASIITITYFFKLFYRIYNFTASKIKKSDVTLKKVCKKVGIFLGTIGGALTFIVTAINNGNKIADLVIKIFKS